MPLVDFDHCSNISVIPRHILRSFIHLKRRIQGFLVFLGWKVFRGSLGWLVVWLVGWLVGGAGIDPLHGALGFKYILGVAPFRRFKQGSPNLKMPNSCSDYCHWERGHTQNVSEQWKQKPVVSGIQGIILLSYVRIMINHYKDPY